MRAGSRPARGVRYKRRADRTRHMSDRTRAHVHVSGTVQGVYYRASTRDAARERGVDGWVRNLEDGRVEAVFEGADPVSRR